jgi:ribonuclease HI
MKKQPNARQLEERKQRRLVRKKERHALKQARMVCTVQDWKGIRPWVLYFDGSCEPWNPGGHSCCGWVLYNPAGKLCARGYRYLCHGKDSTCNVAEYGALEFGLEKVKEFVGEGPLRVLGDSRLIVNQVSGYWGGKKEHLLEARDRVRKLLEGMKWGIEWIPREQNEEADALCQRAYQRYLAGANEKNTTVLGD